MQRKGSAMWQGDLKSGKGTVTTDSGVLSQTPYSFTTRFENGKGTNPEELIAAAHAGCFTMALSAQLGNAGLTPEKLETTATVTFDKLEAEWTVTNILLNVKGKVPKADVPHGIRRRRRLKPAVPSPGCSTRRSRWMQSWKADRRGRPLQSGFPGFALRSRWDACR